jgi:hypothetical protein
MLAHRATSVGIGISTHPEDMVPGLCDPTVINAQVAEKKLRERGRRYLSVFHAKSESARQVGRKESRRGLMKVGGARKWRFRLTWPGEPASPK